MTEQPESRDPLPDTSSQQLAEEAVAILESISDGFFSVNRNGEFAYVNRQAERILDVRRQDILGRTMAEAYPGLAGTAFEDAYIRAIRDKTATEVTAFYPEHGKWYEVRISPAATGLTFYFRDVTAQVATEQALRESERSFRQLAESIPQIVWVVTAAGLAIYFNQVWEDYAGVPIDSSTPADVAGEFVHPDDRAATMAAWGEAYARGGRFQVEHRIRARSGAYRWFLVRAEPYRNDAGAIERWFGTSTDIHDEKLAKIALAESEARYRQLFEALETAGRRHAFQLALADRIRPLTDPGEVTAAASELLGKEVGGKRVVYGETDPDGVWIQMHPDWTTGSMPSMRGVRLRLDDFGVAAVDLLRAGRNLVLDDVTRDAATAPHAAAYRAAGMGAALGIPLMKNGRLHAVLSVHHDQPHHWSTEHIAMAEDMVDRTWFALESVRAQAALRAERDRSQQIFDNMAEGIGLLDSDWTILDVNELGARLARRQHADLVGRDVWTVLPHLAGGPIEALYRRVRERQMPETLEHGYQLDSGALAWIEIRAYPLPESRLAVFYRDISERKAAEATLRESDRRKDEFLAMLAHELRNPLAPIGAAAHLLRLGRLDDERVRHTSQIIGRQVDHMTHLIDDLLDVSRVTRGLVELDMAPVDIRHVVADAIEQMAPLMQKRRHHLHSHIAPDTTVVLGDRQRLVQVLANILNNAAKYTDEGGRIGLTSEVRTDHVVIEVADNGIGMTPELAARAFDLFAQAERSSDRAAGGLGLGLALVKSLVELHGGSVTCDSPGPGQGSRFRVCLPRLQAAAVSGPGETPDAAAAPSGQGLRVLVVDDNADAAAMLAMVLETYGHQVQVEHGSLAALARARGERPDVCILDIGLPDIDGYELAGRLRAQAQTQHAVLIAVTGYGHDSDRRKALAAGFDHHLVKPADAAQLAAILAGVGKARRVSDLRK
jgi:PAS domain S-box-containing protein